MQVCRNVDYWSTHNSVLTLGFFDGVHIGHQYLLERVRKRATRLEAQMVVLTLWPHPRIVLGKEPGNLRLINDLDYKLELLESFGVDAVIVLDFTLEQSRIEPEDFLNQIVFEKIRPQAIYIGYDHYFGHKGRGNYELAAALAAEKGVAVYKGEPIAFAGKEVSSTLLRKSLARGDMQLSKNYMGRDFQFYGRVVRGKQLGSRIGFPTANIAPLNGWQLLPGHGVYSGYCVLGDCSPEVQYKAVINVGSRPTVESDGEVTVEAHLLNFRGNLYGRRIRLGFREKLRNELRFSTLEGLREQIANDVTRVKGESEL